MYKNKSLYLWNMGDSSIEISEMYKNLTRNFCRILKIPKF